jgi:hypothetical protein
LCSNESVVSASLNHLFLRSLDLHYIQVNSIVETKIVII